MSRANLHETDELELFPEWGEPVTSRRGLSRVLLAGIGSIIVHAIVVVAVLRWTLPETTGRFGRARGLPQTFARQLCPLFAPKITAPKIFEVTSRRSRTRAR